jgi:hypothetical protein
MLRTLCISEHTAWRRAMSFQIYTSIPTDGTSGDGIARLKLELLKRHPASRDHMHGHSRVNEISLPSDMHPAVGNAGKAANVRSSSENRPYRRRVLGHFYDHRRYIYEVAVSLWPSSFSFGDPRGQSPPLVSFLSRGMRSKALLLPHTLSERAALICKCFNYGHKGLDLSAVVPKILFLGEYKVAPSRHLHTATRSCMGL